MAAKVLSNKVVDFQQAQQIKKIIKEAVGQIEYGSLTIIKQDNHIIQINKNEILRLG